MPGFGLVKTCLAKKNIRLCLDNLEDFKLHKHYKKSNLARFFRKHASLKKNVLLTIHESQ